MADEATHSPEWLSATWQRRRYVVARGYIRPVVADPTEFYNPLAGVRVQGGRFSHPVQLPQALASIDVSSDQAIEQFTSQWGLLGLITHRIPTLKQQFALRLADDMKDLEISYIDGHPYQVEYGDLRPLLFDPEPIRRTDEVKNAVLQEQEILAIGRSGLPERMSVADFLWSHFPDHQPHVVYPIVFGTDDRSRPVYPGESHLLDPRIWDCLAEFVDDFRNSVERFQRAYHLASDQRSSALLGKAEELERLFSEGQAGISMVPKYAPENGGWSLRATLPSLLSAAYFALGLQLTGQDRPAFCENESCRKAFAAGRSSKRFCSIACQESQKKRNKRRRAPGSLS